MPISAHLLERAYQLIDAGQLQNAELVLEAIVRVDPKNVMAWKVYLQICPKCTDLDWLMERILATPELNAKDKADICAFQEYVSQSLDKRIQHVDELMPKRTFSISSPAHGDEVIFELLEEFEYPEHKVERAKRKRSRKIFKYDIPMYVWRAAALLLVFYSAIRMLVLGHLFGFLLMVAFIVGGFYWIKNINAHKTTPFIETTHAYALESEKELFIIDKPPSESTTKENKNNSPDVRYLDK
ncbi:MAG: hypothetical protein NTW69_19705 [Chloroflexi bacterium]|nr:hypothetical protein [Chloroflexota bacterium]